MRYDHLYDWASTQMSWGTLRFDAMLLQINLLWSPDSARSHSHGSERPLAAPGGPPGWGPPGRPALAPCHSQPQDSQPSLARPSLEFDRREPLQSCGLLRRSQESPGPRREPPPGSLRDSQATPAGPLRVHLKGDPDASFHYTVTMYIYL